MPLFLLLPCLRSPLCPVNVPLIRLFSHIMCASHDCWRKSRGALFSLFLSSFLLNQCVVWGGGGGGGVLPLITMVVRGVSLFFLSLFLFPLSPSLRHLSKVLLLSSCFFLFYFFCFVLSNGENCWHDPTRRW